MRNNPPNHSTNFSNHFSHIVIIIIFFQFQFQLASQTRIIYVYIYIKNIFFGVFRLRREYLFNHLGSLNWFSGTMYDSFFFSIVSFANSCSFFRLHHGSLDRSKRNETEKKSQKEQKKKKFKRKILIL